MKDALLSDDIKELYDFFKSENDSIPSFEKFKKETIKLYHDKNNNYASRLSNIILEKPLVYSYKNQVSLQTDAKKLHEWYPFIDLNLFNNK